MLRRLILKAGLGMFLLLMVCYGRSYANDFAWGNSKAGTGASENTKVAGMLRATLPGNGTKIFLPLKQTDVFLEITAGVITARVTQIFRNDTAYPLEAIYIFPLPSMAAVTDMNLLIGERKISSVVKERVEAKKIYEKAKAEGKRTALLEQERPNIFTTSVANFLPGETAKISFSYMEPIQYKKGIYSITFPMVVGQRYIPFKLDKGASSVPDGDRINPPLLHPNVDPEHKLTLRAEIRGLLIREIISNTHAIHVERNGENPERTRVSLAQALDFPDRDFNIKLYMKEKGTPQISFLHSKKHDANYGMLSVFPPLKKKISETVSIPRDVIFLIDTSGSMAGESISQAKAGLKHCLSMLREEDSFTIVRFANSYSSFSPELRKADQKTIQAAAWYISGLSAGGGTEMQKALGHVLSLSKNKGSMKIIVFLTDGDVGNEASLMRLLSKRLNQARLFTFGIGSAPNEYLMRKMAETGRGQSRFIRSHEDIGEVMADFFQTLDAPVLTDISIGWVNNEGKEITNIPFYPNPCPDVFYDRPLQIYAKYPESFRGKLIISGMLDGKKVRYSFPIDQKKNSDYSAIDKMFGRAKINELMYRFIKSNAEEERGGIRSEVIGTAITHQLVSKFTSRVAVEEKIVRGPDESLVSVKVPVPLPRGWDPAQFTPTATNNTQLLVLGLSIFFSGCLLCTIRKLIVR